MEVKPGAGSCAFQFVSSFRRYHAFESGIVYLTVLQPEPFGTFMITLLQNIIAPAKLLEMPGPCVAGTYVLPAGLAVNVHNNAASGVVTETLTEVVTKAVTKVANNIAVA